MRRSLAVVAAAALVQAPAAAGWTWPVDGPVLRPFVLGNDPYAAGQHRGIDIGASPGTTVRAATAGKASFVGTVPAGGRAVTVRTAGGLSVTYLELGATRVERGAEVAEGDTIGSIGPASHVHLGVRVTADEHGYLDPLQFLPPRVTGPARADPVQEAPAGGGQPEPVVTESADRAEPPTAQTEAQPKPEPAPVVPAAPSAPAAAPSPAPVATEPAPAPVTATQAPEAKTAEGVQAAPQWAPAAHDPGGPSHARRVTAPKVARAAPALHPARPPSNGGSRAQRERSPRPRARTVTPLPPLVARVRHKPVVAVPAPEDRAIESHRGSGRTVQQSDSERRIPLLVAAVLLLGVVGGIAATVRRRRQGASAWPPSAGSCSLGRMRPSRLLHACARGGEMGWPASATRSPSLAQLYRPLPRPRRRVPAETVS
jgi:Peptidase family M23